jgi:hypothetical protein
MLQDDDQQVAKAVEFW